MSKTHLLLRSRPTRVGLMLLVLAFLLSVALATGIVCHAQEPTQECNGLDIVFLIDQSDSMNYNDRNQIRSEAVRTAIDILGDNAVYFCPGTQHRIAVIGFGNAVPGRGSTKTYVASAVISATVDTLAEWNQQRETVIKASIPLTDSLGATDHLAALEAATDVLQAWQLEPLGEGLRKSGVVLVTDGGPCPDVVDGKCQWLEFETRDRYLKQIRILADPIGASFPWRGEDNPNSVFLWIIAFNDATAESAYSYLNDEDLLNRWKGIAQGHGGDLLILPRRAELETANAELTSIVASILDPVLGSNLALWDCHQPIWVDPYVSNVTIIHIFRRGANPGVPLDQVNVRIRAERGGETIAEFNRGQVIGGEGQVNDYTRDGPNERYVFYFPPPGRYIVDVEGADICEDLDVRIGSAAIQAELLESLEDAVFSEVDEFPYYDTVSPRPFHFQLWQQGIDEGTEPLVEQPGFPLTLTVRVQGPSDAPEPVDDVYHLQRMDGVQAIYESRDPTTGNPAYIRTRYPGTYAWELIAETTNPRRFDETDPVATPLTVLRRTGTFRVVPVQRFGFQVAEPTHGDVVLVNEIENGKPVPVPVQVTIQFVDEAGDPLNPQRVLASEEADTFELNLSDANGRLLETITLRPTFGSPNLSTQMRVLSSGKSPDPPGEYHLDVRLLGNYVIGQFRPTVSQQRLTFMRTVVQSFSFSMTRPIEGENLPLIEGVAPDLVRAEVQLLDDEGDPLSPDSFIPAPDAAPWTASLLDAQGRLLDSKPMRLATGGKVFAAKLGSGETDPKQYAPGCYQILVELSDDYRSEVFRPKQKQLERNFCMELVRQFTWHIAEPISGTHSIHPGLRWFPDPMPLPLSVEVSPLDDKPLLATDLLRPEASNLLAGRLLVPGTETPYDLVFRPGEQAGQFVADWPHDVASKGRHTLEVSLIGGNLSPTWVPTNEEPLSQAFQRQDTLLTMPWSLLALIILIVIIAVAMVLLYLATGPLAGAVLVFTRRRR